MATLSVVDVDVRALTHFDVIFIHFFFSSFCLLIAAVRCFDYK